MVGVRLLRTSLLTNVLVLALAAPMVVPGVEAAPVVIFEDDFNDGIIDTSKWLVARNVSETSACGTVEGSGAMHFGDIGALERELISQPIETGEQSILSFWLFSGPPQTTSDKCDGADVVDTLTVEQSIDGGATWISLAIFEGESFPIFTLISLPLLPSNGEPSLIRWFNSISDNNFADSWTIDEVMITHESFDISGIPKTHDNGDGSCTVYDDQNNNDQVDPGEELATVPCPDLKVRDNGDGTFTLYDDHDHDGQIDPGEEIATTPAVTGPPTGGTTTRTLLDLNDVTITPSQPLPPEDVPGQTTPDYPGTGPVATPDYPGTEPEETPDYPGTNPVATPDYPGTGPVPTPPVGEDVGTLSVQDNAAGEVCIDFTPEGGSAQNVACVNRAFLGPADGLVPRGDTTVFVTDPPDVPGTPPQPVPDVPGTPPVAVPDVPGTPPQPVPDVPGTPSQDVPDVPPTPTGSLGETPRTSLDLDVSYTYDSGRLTKVAGALGDAVQFWSPVSPDPTDAEWFATHGDDVSLCFSFVLYEDGVERGSASQCVPFLGQALAAAEATAGTLP